ncbi:uncharacterized protein LOC123226878 isoform X5 [Mangifera indica]|uniref:uncharacterized protein LOC123226878 isoform X5 n=1 Tax=Mangifera indica TaxID=29780 RepID=UPI001CF9761F|nr:uncharacterized protein LOC123226878 isoform X5 [Mangifera indica]
MICINKSRLDAMVSMFVTVHPHETSALLHSSSCFFFILSAYFVVLPLRDEGAISLGLSNLPGLFVGSLFLTLIAAPVSTLIFSSHNLSKCKALVLIHRFFSVSLVVFYILWQSSSAGYLWSNMEGKLKEDLEGDFNHTSPGSAVDWSNRGWFYVSVRIGFFLWVALLNLITISSTWARVIDVMDSESGSRLFGFVGAGATFGQLFGSLFATAMAFLGPSRGWFIVVLLLFAALLMELAAQSSKGINKDISQRSEESTPIREADSDQQNETDVQTAPAAKAYSPKLSTLAVKPRVGAILDGLWLILSSTYLLYVSLFLWLSAVVSSFFYFQKVTVIAMTVASSVGRRRLFAQINSFTAIFILTGQLTLTVVTYVVTRPGRELLFTVVSQEEKYKAKVCIDVIVQRLGDASAAGMYGLLFGTLQGRTSSVSLYALPTCLFSPASGVYIVDSNSIPFRTPPSSTSKAFSFLPFLRFF